MARIPVTPGFQYREGDVIYGDGRGGTEVERTTTDDEVLVPKVVVGRALMLLDEFPPAPYGTNMEYAPPGTAAWIAKAKRVLTDLTRAEA